MISVGPQQSDLMVVAAQMRRVIKRRLLSRDASKPPPPPSPKGRRGPDESSEASITSLVSTPDTTPPIKKVNQLIITPNKTNPGFLIFFQPTPVILFSEALNLEENP